MPYWNMSRREQEWEGGISRGLRHLEAPFTAVHHRAYDGTMWHGVARNQYN